LYGPSLEVFCYEFVYFLNLLLGEGKQSSWKRFWCFWVYFYGMVPYCVLGKSLGFFFVKYLFVSAVFGWDFGCGGVVVVWWGEGDSSHIYFVGYGFL